MGLMEDFLADAQGKKFADLHGDLFFTRLIAFFDDADRQRRMIESERHHDRPPLAGVVRELERELFPVKPRTRLKQCVGAIVRVIMRQKQWVPAGRGSLSNRELSKWFSRAERYNPPIVLPSFHGTSESTRRYHQRQALADDLRKKVGKLTIPKKEKDHLLMEIKEAIQSISRLQKVERKIVEWPKDDDWTGDEWMRAPPPYGE